jgi:glycosyltransferase involved in cell wall biosynthesis
MKIAYDHSIFTRQRYGGISRYITELMRGMIAAGHQPCALAPLHGNAYLQADPSLPRRGIYAGSAFYRFKGPFIYLNGLINPLQARCFRPDILHETYFAPQRTAPRGLPTVVTVHDMTHERFPERFSPGDPSPGLKRRAVQRADQVICISAHTRSDLIRMLQVPEEKIRVIHHGFRPFYPGDPENLPHPLGGRSYILFVGERRNYKNFSGLLEAFALARKDLEPDRLVAFGGGPFREDELALIRKWGLAGKVIQTGGNDFRLACHYRHARAFLFPSLYEGFGFPLLESMSLGCPVGASGNSALPEIAGEAALYFNPDDPGEIARILIRLCGDERLRQELIAKGHQRQAAFSWTNCARQTLQVYEQFTK